MADDKKNEKSGDDKMREAIAEAIKSAMVEALPLAAAMATKVSKDHDQASEPEPVKAVSNDKCGTCRQMLRACQGKHKRLVVFPREYGQFFTGISINGIKYLSNNSQHQILVPENSNIEHILEKWESNERELSVGRQVQHNSGTLSANGASNVHHAGSDGSSFR